MGITISNSLRHDALLTVLYLENNCNVQLARCNNHILGGEVREGVRKKKRHFIFFILKPSP